MSASLVGWNPVDEQLQSRTALVRQLRQEVDEFRRENAELRCDVGYWKSMHARAVERNARLQAELDQAQAEIRQLKAERFGKQSEKQSATDRSNDLDDPQDRAKPKKKRGQQPGRPAPRRRDYSHLPVREEVIDLSPDAKVCDCCGLPLEDLGHRDAGEQIEIETVVYRRVVRRKRYRRTCDCAGRKRTVTAPPPPKLLPKSIYGTSVWVHLLLEKFHLQRPTHRTIEQLRLLEVNLAPGTITDGLKRIEPLFTPIYEAILAHHVQSGYFQADETRWQVFVEKAGKIGHRWWLWLFAGEDAVVFVLDPSRSHDVPQSHFPGDVQGVLMVDRYSAYKAMSQVKEGKLLLAFCWAHVRRDFVRVWQRLPGTQGVGAAVAASDPRVVSPESRATAACVREPRVRLGRGPAASARCRHGGSARYRTGRREASQTMPQSARKFERTLERIDVVRRRPTHSHGQQLRRATDPQPSRWTQELLWFGGRVGRSFGNDDVLDLRHPYALEDQPTNVAALVLRCLCRSRRHSPGQSAVVLTLELVETPIG